MSPKIRETAQCVDGKRPSKDLHHQPNLTGVNLNWRSVHMVYERECLVQSIEEPCWADNFR
jgi:hypothetical protein